MLYIVTTTINSPTEATRRYAKIAEARKDVKFVIVCDRKTPIKEYTETFENNDSIYLYLPSQQEEDFPELSETIGWNTIQRRNLGFAYVYKHSENHEKDFIATVDDDNIPYSTWLEPYKWAIDGETSTIAHIECTQKYGDPLSIFNFFREHNISHRGFLRKFKSNPDIDRTKIKSIDLDKIDVIAALWDGAPDIDAIDRYKIDNKYVSMSDEYRLLYYQLRNNYYKFNNSLTVFNSQNTFIRIKLLPYYMCIPHTGRMDDIWGAYLLQDIKPDINIIFSYPTVYQERNEHNVFKDIELETHGYVVDDFDINLLSPQSLNCYDTYFETLIKYKKD